MNHHSYILPIVALCALTPMRTFRCQAQTYTPKYELINKAGYDTYDMAVATFNVMDYGVDNTGIKDCTATFQALLNQLGGGSTSSSADVEGNYANLSGGILYVPEGVYLLKGQLVVPRGVTIRGDRKKSSGGEAVEGTIIKVSPRSGRGSTDESKAFITMQPATQVENLIFWYPDQKISNVVAYPPTVLFGQKGYWGNDYCNVRHCTFVNSYTAVAVSAICGGGCPNVFDVDGSPLHEGVVIDAIADVGRIDGVDFSPSYWACSGLSDSPSEEELRNYLQHNATGIVMRRNDWSFTSNVSIDSYKVGFHAEESPSTAALQGTPNGHNYNFTLTNCATGVNLVATNDVGIMFTRVSTEGGDYGIRVNSGMSGIVQLYGCDISSGGYAVYADENSGASVLMQDCDVRAETRILGGTLVATGNRFYDDAMVWTNARATFSGNSMEDGAKYSNLSIYESYENNASLNLRSLPDFKDEWMQTQATRPAQAKLFVATDAEFGATAVDIKTYLSSVADNTSAIQSALDKAKSEGGGIVYLPAGHYRMDGTLTIPTGVELKGAADISAAPMGSGAVLECYAGEGNENGTPFITMEKNSGLRGLTINYPKQDNPTSVLKYPYTVRGNEGVYIVNLALRTSYKGIDLFTNKCDNHYIDYISGHCFANVIRVGGDCGGGRISNLQMNTGSYAYGNETKFGQWPNSEKMDSKYGLNYSDKAYGQNKEDLEFLIVGDCHDEVLYNNFLFGCNKGMYFISDGKGGASNVHAVGNAVDGAVNTFVIDAIGGDLDLVNSQIVALNNSGTGVINKGTLEATFMTLGSGCSGKTVTLFSSDSWGAGEYMLTVGSGTLNYYQPCFNQSGTNYTFSVANGGKINFVGGHAINVNNITDGKSATPKNTSVTASVIDCTGAGTSDFAAWTDNLPTSWTIADGITETHYRWTITANNDETGSERTARKGADGSLGTYWSTEENQQSGQWFRVQFYNQTTLNAIILRSSSSGGPASYKVEVSSDGNSWTEMASGTNGGETLVIPFSSTVTTKNVRISLTGSSSQPWIINEFDVANLDAGQLSGVSSPTADEFQPMRIQGRNVRIDSRLVHGSTLEMFTPQGQRVAAMRPDSDTVEFGSLSQGVYIVRLTSDSRNFRQTRKTLIR